NASRGECFAFPGFGLQAGPTVATIFVLFMKSPFRMMFRGIITEGSMTEQKDFMETILKLHCQEAGRFV
ncbi:MAG: hypothetical protein WC352_08945, partial [Candidatus Omnitrophota bacterium]